MFCVTYGLYFYCFFFSKYFKFTIFCDGLWVTSIITKFEKLLSLLNKLVQCFCIYVVKFTFVIYNKDGIDYSVF
jgi:hypothetical protein